MRYSPVRCATTQPLASAPRFPMSLARDAFLGAPAARLLSRFRGLSAPVQVLARFHSRRAAVHTSPRDTGNPDGDRRRALRYASSLETLGIWAQSQGLGCSRGEPAKETWK